MTGLLICTVHEIYYSDHNIMDDAKRGTWAYSKHSRDKKYMKLFGQKILGKRVLDRYKHRSKYVVKLKVKCALEQATKAHRGSRGIDLIFLQSLG